jgi:hypothetical protein
MKAILLLVILSIAAVECGLNMRRMFAVNNGNKNGHNKGNFNGNNNGFNIGSNNGNNNG